MRSYFEQPVALEWPVGVFRKNPEEIELASGERFLITIRRVDEHALRSKRAADSHFLRLARTEGHGRAGRVVVGRGLAIGAEAPALFGGDFDRLFVDVPVDHLRTGPRGQ